MKEAEKIRVQVEIFGIQYTLITDSSAVHARKMANMVDQLMTKNDQNYPRLEQAKLAVLSALQLADENLQLEQELQQGFFSALPTPCRVRHFMLTRHASSQHTERQVLHDLANQHGFILQQASQQAHVQWPGGQLRIQPPVGG